jgi:hypothetical protein
MLAVVGADVPVDVEDSAGLPVGGDVAAGQAGQQLPAAPGRGQLAQTAAQRLRLGSAVQAD